MPLVINDAKWWKSKHYQELSKNKKFSKEFKYGSIKKPIYYTVKKEENLDDLGNLDTYMDCEFKELKTLEKTFDGKWTYLTLRYLVWKYPKLTFWTPLKNRPQFWGSTEGDVCNTHNKKLLAKFMIPDDYVGVELDNEEVHCISNLILEMSMPDDMKPISRPISIPQEQLDISELTTTDCDGNTVPVVRELADGGRIITPPENMTPEIAKLLDIPYDPPTEEAMRLAAEFPLLKPMLRNGFLNQMLAKK